MERRGRGSSSNDGARASWTMPPLVRTMGTRGVKACVVLSRPLEDVSRLASSICLTKGNHRGVDRMRDQPDSRAMRARTPGIQPCVHRPLFIHSLFISFSLLPFSSSFFLPFFFIRLEPPCIYVYIHAYILILPRFFRETSPTKFFGSCRVNVHSNSVGRIFLHSFLVMGLRTRLDPWLPVRSL